VVTLSVFLEKITSMRKVYLKQLNYMHMAFKSTYKNKKDELICNECIASHFGLSLTRILQVLEFRYRVFVTMFRIPVSRIRACAGKTQSQTPEVVSVRKEELPKLEAGG
jgi:hypothetical protein